MGRKLSKEHRDKISMALKGKRKTKEHRRKLSSAMMGKLVGPKAYNFKDITGKRFNMLTVIKYVGSKKTRGSMWECECDCGGTVIADGSHLRSGHTISCGCLSRRNGPDNPRWRGGTYFSNGYKYIYKPGHPNAFKNGKYVGEHTFVMSEHIGRPIKKGEIVHHKNGNKLDNRIENLDLRVKKEHPPLQSVGDLVADAIETLKEYAPDKLCKDCHKEES
jgi:hypothetical protein